MIEIDFGKLILLALVALIVLGPEKLPGAARTAGALLRRLRSGWDSVRAEVERELEIEEIRRAAREAAAHAEAAQAQLDSALGQLRDPLAQAAAKAGETFRLTGEAPTDEPSSAGDNASPPDESAMQAGAKTEQGQGQGKGRPLTPASFDGLGTGLSAENGLGGEGAERGELPAPGAGSPDADCPVTGQLFGDAPVSRESTDGGARKAAHGGH